MSLRRNHNIFFIHPYPEGQAPGQRFRFEQYLDILRSNGYNLYLFPFLNDAATRVLYEEGHYIKKVGAVMWGFLRRIKLLFLLHKADFVFLYREAAPFGPPLFEWIIAKVLRKKIIYDFDDAIWLTDRLNESWLEKILRWRWKVRAITRWSYKVSCGNEYLCAYAKQFNPHIHFLPTTIDTEKIHNTALYPLRKEQDTITIGWTGSHSTLKYLDQILPVIEQLEKKYSQFRFLVVANKKPVFKLRSLEFVKWKTDTEVPDLLTIDIGIMPLPDDEWSRGKCALKALQYMALEIPVVLSPVGANLAVVQNGITGFHASTPEEWYTSLDMLVSNKDLRQNMGNKGRAVVMNDYSVSSKAGTFLSLFT